MEEHHLLIALASIIVFGTAAQWLSARLRLPSILLLLGAGFLAGPVLNLLKPDEIFGELLFPAVSLCVSVILFEGALSLQFSELRQIGRTLLHLLTIGVLVTWVLSALAAHFLLGMSAFISVLLGAILVVTGPTVIGPLLRQIRPTGQVGPLAKWEGIVIDPIGAVLAVLVYEAHVPFIVGEIDHGTMHALRLLGWTILLGIGVGSICAWLLSFLLKRHAIPDHLETLVTLMFVMISFTLSHVLVEESGLVAVTVMGILMANSRISLKHIVEFKESLSLLMISVLFIVLAARVEMQDFYRLGWRGPAFVAFLILVVRPLAVLLSTLGSKLKWSEVALLSWLAPRGIVAAAVASVFSIKLGDQAQNLVPATFLLIVGTVVTYGLTTFPFAKWLGLASDNPQGVLIIGSHQLARMIAHAVDQAGFPVMLVDTNRRNLSMARMEGLPTANINVLQEHVTEILDLGGMGRLLALTSNDEVNALGSIHFAEIFGRANVFQLTPWRSAEKNQEPASHLRSRYLFGKEFTYDSLMKYVRDGSTVKVTKLTEEFTYKDFQARYRSQAVPLFLTQGKKLTVVDGEQKIDPQVGQTLIALVPPLPEADPEPIADSISS